MPWLPDTLLGQCMRRPQRFVVLLNDQLAEEQAVEVLCHAWAHALTRNHSLDRMAQSPDLDRATFDRGGFRPPASAAQRRRGHSQPPPGTARRR